MEKNIPTNHEFIYQVNDTERFVFKVRERENDIIMRSEINIDNWWVHKISGGIMPLEIVKDLANAILNVYNKNKENEGN